MKNFLAERRKGQQLRVIVAAMFVVPIALVFGVVMGQVEWRLYVVAAGLLLLCYAFGRSKMNYAKKIEEGFFALPTLPAVVREANFTTQDRADLEKHAQFFKDSPEFSLCAKVGTREEQSYLLWASRGKYESFPKFLFCASINPAYKIDAFHSIFAGPDAQFLTELKKRMDDHFEFDLLAKDGRAYVIADFNREGFERARALIDFVRKAP